MGLIKLLVAKTIGAENIDCVILKKDFFPNIDAGEIDAFIENKFPGFISRNPDMVNGVSVTPTEIVIATNFKLSDLQINTVIQQLEQRFI